MNIMELLLTGFLCGLAALVVVTLVETVEELNHQPFVLRDIELDDSQRFWVIKQAEKILREADDAS